MVLTWLRIIQNNNEHVCYEGKARYFMRTKEVRGIFRRERSSYRIHPSHCKYTAFILRDHQWFGTYGKNLITILQRNIQDTAITLIAWLNRYVICHYNVLPQIQENSNIPRSSLRGQHICWNGNTSAARCRNIGQIAFSQHFFWK